MRDGTWIYVCGGLWCLMPLITFSVGLALGRQKLPYRIKLERVEYAAQDGAE